nr:3-epi-6-deoxocathasterone 23-monooxygenase [Ipomoea batatas]
MVSMNLKLLVLKHSQDCDFLFCSKMETMLFALGRNEDESTVYLQMNNRRRENREEMEEKAAAIGSGLDLAIVIATAVMVAAAGAVWLVVARRKETRKPDNDDGEIDGRVPRGSSGWPLLGETLDFIASGYTSRPVSFMEKRKSL